MKAHCPACGRLTRMAEDVLDFLVRCERCRTMLLARSPAVGLVAVKAEVLPLGRMPERFGPTQRTDLAELLTHRRRGSVTGATRAFVRRSQTERGHGLVGACMALAAAVMVVVVIGVGYWKIHTTAQTASAAGLTVHHVTNDAANGPASSHAEAYIPDENDRATTSMQTATGTGELFPDVPAKQ